MKRALSWLLTALLLLTLSAAQAEETVQIDWTARYTYSELEEQLQAISASCP